MELNHWFEGGMLWDIVCSYLIMFLSGSASEPPCLGIVIWLCDISAYLPCLGSAHCCSVVRSDRARSRVVDKSRCTPEISPDDTPFY